jgi:hypothetical protein
MMEEITSSAQKAFAAFQQANSPTHMAQVVAQYTFMVDESLITTVEQVIDQQVPPGTSPCF